MLKTCFAAAILAVFALAVPARAQPFSDAELARFDRTCIAQGNGPETAGYNDCITKKKTDSLQQAQRRAADLAAMPKALNPLPLDLMYMLPEGTRALQGVPPVTPTRTVTTTKVCVTQGDPAKPETDSNAAKPEEICHTDVAVELKAAAPAPRDYRDDPTAAMAHTAMHPGDIFHDHIQAGGQ